jgi:NADPH-dependent F420 reductase
VAVPAYHLTDTIESVVDEPDESILVSPAVGMQRDEDGLHYNPPAAGSVTALAAKTAPEGVPVVGTFHNLAAGRLGNLEQELDWDVPVVANDQEAKETVTSLVAEIKGLRPLDAGGISNASEVEAITPLLINVAANNKNLHDLGVKFW